MLPVWFLKVVNIPNHFFPHEAVRARSEVSSAANLWSRLQVHRYTCILMMNLFSASLILYIIIGHQQVWLVIKYGVRDEVHCKEPSLIGRLWNNLRSIYDSRHHHFASINIFPGHTVANSCFQLILCIVALCIF